MASCGYLCPVCEGRQYLDDGKPCQYCNNEQEEAPSNSDEAKKEEG
jgi:hypothetical protein